MSDTDGNISYVMANMMAKIVNPVHFNFYFLNAC